MNWKEEDIRDHFYVSQDCQSNNVDLKRLITKISFDRYQFVVSSKIWNEFSKSDLIDYLNNKKYFLWKD